MNAQVLWPTLYTPATTAPAKLLQLVNGDVADVRRLVICTEDAVSEDDVPQALRHLAQVFQQCDTSAPTQVFVRARNAAVLKRLLNLPYVERITGFVIPKATPRSFPEFAEPILAHHPDFRLMPILEAPEMTSPAFRDKLLQTLSRYRGSIDCLRIGGNDLMGHQGIRRDDWEYTVYDTVVGTLIANIVNEFRGSGGFMITAPVFECFDEIYDDLFRREARRSILNEMFGQTVIHPRHIPLLLELYKVRERDYDSALAITSSSTAVVGRHGKMDEETTHSKWAATILQRAELFGIRESAPMPAPALV